ncbi:alanine:cation symporter family protein [Suttonella sp. R2A3]|uniref:alanine/glycine:cation symporter family protein n=1 Tax=Suttonella sp. R2A3 TaxID=2908648 RepID=UPI001F3576AE|nr:alanine/glycine:cation symporter family protein [Suttonella sp. R2A3]UJF24012.1 alanine:cation symporter family protein [Suttonella sp. R2A3]
MADFIASIHGYVDIANGLLWGKVLIVLLIGAGLYFSVLTRFVQVRMFAHSIGLIKHSRSGGGLEHGVSSFQALATSLAARVGTGNLAGVAIAITLGGPGAVFWMWITALVGMATAFIESTLGQVYKVAGEKPGQFRGGPAYYIERGLKQRWLGIVFAICLLIAFGFAFNAAQANTIADALNETMGWDVKWIGIGLVLLVAPIIFSGVHRVGQVSEVIVPLMALGYILIGMFILITNLDKVPGALMVIYKSAFGLDQAVGGFFGGLAAAMLNGIKRGLFSNEAGMGSAPNIAAAATTVPKHPAVQGFMQMFGVFVDTLLICTVTAVIIILAGPEYYVAEGVKGITLTQNALSSFIGSWGAHYISIALFFFAFTSVLGNYSYGESNIAYIAGERNANVAVIIFRFLVLGVVYLGSVADLSQVWAYADLAMGMMAVINLIAILLLGHLALRVLKDYERQIQSKGIMQLDFNPANFPVIGKGVDPKAWPTL